MMYYVYSYTQRRTLHGPIIKRSNAFKLSKGYPIPDNVVVLNEAAWEVEVTRDAEFKQSQEIPLVQNPIAEIKQRLDDAFTVEPPALREDWPYEVTWKDGWESKHAGMNSLWLAVDLCHHLQSSSAMDVTLYCRAQDTRFMPCGLGMNKYVVGLEYKVLAATTRG